MICLILGFLKVRASFGKFFVPDSFPTVYSAVRELGGTSKAFCRRIANVITKFVRATRANKDSAQGVRCKQLSQDVTVHHKLFSDPCEWRIVFFAVLLVGVSSSSKRSADCMDSSSWRGVNPFRSSSSANGPADSQCNL